MRGSGLPRGLGSRRVWLAVLGAAGLVAVSTAGIASAGVPSGSLAPQAVFNVRNFGATGNGSTNDTPAIERAINAAADVGGGTVEFPPGTYRAGGTIHLKSNITIMLDAGATVTGSSSGYDPPESNPFDDFQDFGHSHFHNAMFYGDRLSNIAFVGPGAIDGNDHLITGNPSSGQADKIISLTRCNGLTLNNITLRQGGHFAALINGCTNVTSDHLTIRTAGDRDGWNIISTTNVTITNADIAANDDALVFKSDYALGAKLTNGHVTVTDSRLSAGCCNALMFGSETCGDFTDYNFDRITITGANKSGLGLVSMDGAVISDVHYRNITMTGVSSPIMQKIGTRRRCGNNPGIGSIHHITYDNITGVGKSSPQYSPTLWGADSTHRIHDISFNNVKLTVPGAHSNIGTGVPSNDPNNYNPNSIGTRPSYGWYIHNANNISFTSGSQVDYASGDARPAVITNAGSTVTFDGFKAERSTGSTDMVFQSINPYCVRNSTNTAGGALRISTTGSTQSCPAQGSDFSLGLAPASQTVSPGGTATFTVSTAVVSGTPGDVSLSVTGLPAGTTPSFSTNPVAAGGSSTLTVPIPADTAAGTFTVTVTGTAGTVTHSATAQLVVGTTGGLTISGLSVADTANAADWSIQSNLRVGSVQYGDRTFTLTAVPAALTGQQWIRTANDSKAATNNPLVRFTISTSATVAVAVDTRIGRRSWMDSTWVDTGTQIRNNESTPRSFEVFTKTFPAGQVALGPNGSTGSSNYMIVVF